MNVYVTGGNGYIGSHIAKYLKEHTQHNVIIVDWANNSNKIPLYCDQFMNQDFARVSNYLSTWPDVIIHCAAYTSSPESTIFPPYYYDNNTAKTIQLLQNFTQAKNPIKFIFSSTAAVYGNAKWPSFEADFTYPTTPYGRSKLMVEQVLKDSAHLIDSVSFRYFNAAGAHHDGSIGYRPDNESLIPNMLRAIKTGKHLQIYGTGTDTRDYVHVWDIARAHVMALDFLEKNSGAHVFNLGQEKAHSVLDIMEQMCYITGKEVPHEFQAPRVGDVSVSLADARKAEKELGWNAGLSIPYILQDAYRWHFGPIYSRMEKE